MTPIKICGITRMEDAVLAADLGAFAVGFVFWPHSPRAIAVERARTIVDALPADVLKVGVFVDQPVAEVKRIAAATSLNVVQLHGNECAEQLRQFERPVFKSVAVAESFAPEHLNAIPTHVTVLLDAHDPIMHGGTGRTIDWAKAAEAAAQRPCVLSGGLTPENVRAAVEQVRPFAVDVSSGVEAAPGIKDHARLRAFFEALRHG
jgi:phosphoribosylanthranilate isomerase